MTEVSPDLLLTKYDEEKHKTINIRDLAAILKMDEKRCYNLVTYRYRIAVFKPDPDWNYAKKDYSKCFVNVKSYKEAVIKWQEREIEKREKRKSKLQEVKKVMKTWEIE